MNIPCEAQESPFDSPNTPDEKSEAVLNSAIWKILKVHQKKQLETKNWSKKKNEIRNSFTVFLCAYPTWNTWWATKSNVRYMFHICWVSNYHLMLFDNCNNRKGKKKIQRFMVYEEFIHITWSQQKVTMPSISMRITKDLRNKLETLENPLHFGCQKRRPSFPHTKS